MYSEIRTSPQTESGKHWVSIGDPCVGAPHEFGANGPAGGEPITLFPGLRACSATAVGGLGSPEAAVPSRRVRRKGLGQGEPNLLSRDLPSLIISVGIPLKPS